MTRRKGGIPAALRKSWQKTYSDHRYHELPWFSRSPFPAVRKAVEQRAFRSRGRMLDLGCGAGTNAMFLAASGFRTTGVDLAPGAIEAAQSRAQTAGLSVDFRVGDALDLPFKAGTFSGLIDVGCFHTIPIRLRRRYAEEAARVLVPRGRFLLSWVAREYTRNFGPPHRPSVEEVADVFEGRFLVRLTEFAEGKYGLPSYSALLERRERPQPPPR